MSTASPESAAPLALPSAGGERPGNVVNLAALLVGTAVTMAFGALLAAYLQVRALAQEWPPPDVELDNYLGVTLAITLLLSAFTVEWAPYALKRGNRRQALWGFGITLGFGLAFLNLLWFLVSELGFGPADHAYGTLVYALLAAAIINVVLGGGFLLVALLRTAGHQVGADDPELARAAAWYWQFVVATWLMAFVALYILHHR